MTAFANKYAKKVERDEVVAIALSCKICGGRADVGCEKHGYLCWRHHDLALHQQGRHRHQMLTSNPAHSPWKMPTWDEIRAGDDLVHPAYAPKDDVNQQKKAQRGGTHNAIDALPDWMKAA